MQRYFTLFSPHTIRTTLHLLRRYEILKLRTTNGYRPFHPLAFILGIMLGPRELLRFFRKLLVTKHYMSTRYADNQTFGWTIPANIELSRSRVAQLPPDTLNPATDIVSLILWTPTEKMVFWVWVIVALSKKGATFYHFTEDNVGSVGCQKELAMARELNMPIITLP